MACKRRERGSRGSGLRIRPRFRDFLLSQLVEGTKHWKIYGEAPIYMPYPSEQVGKNGLEVPPELLDSTPAFEQTLKVSWAFRPLFSVKLKEKES